MMLSTAWNVATLPKRPTLVRIVAIVLLTVANFPIAAQAQITPDGTLGGELSTVTEGAMVRGDLADLIEGGAVRGSNLFHSFLEFNVGEGQRVYFASPVGIESILNRVTGDAPSNIFGILGVDGSADLFLLNPNGLVFGENAALDIEGSFYGTTGSAIELGNGVFSAVAPEQSRLLTVNPSVQLENYLTAASGNIENRGQLAASGDLMLVANVLDLQGQIAAGDDLTLLALDEVQIRDASETPFIGFAGDDLLVQGNEQVDIVVLSHPDSGLYSYGDMVLRSANPVGGDAHYWSGGSFRIETLDGEIGDLFSPIDPVIRTLGDVAIGAYTGTSLHILAGGSVQLGTAIITGPAVGELGIDFIQETIELSDGTPIQINGAAQPTLDVRAGILPEAIGFPNLDLFPGIAFGTAFTDIPSNADINVNNIFMNAPDGLVLLTNQYEPNAELSAGDIRIENPLTGGGIVAGSLQLGVPGGGKIAIDARDDISVINSVVTTLSLEDSGSEIFLLAKEDIRLDGSGGFITGAVTGVPFASTARGGDIRVAATNLELSNGAQINATTLGLGDAGNITIDLRGKASFDGINPLNQIVTGIRSSALDTASTGNAGQITLNAESLSITNGAGIESATAVQGNSGDITITVDKDIQLDGNTILNVLDANGNLVPVTRTSFISTSVGASAAGQGGNINVTSTSGSLLLEDGAQFFANTFGQESNEGLPSDAGNITIDVAENISLRSGAQLRSDTSGQGSAGEITLMAGETVEIDGIELINDQLTPSAISSSVRRDVDQSTGVPIIFAGAGNAGNITVDAKSFALTNGAVIESATFNQGNAGDVTIIADGAVELSGNRTFEVPNAEGNLVPITRLSNISTTVSAGAVGQGGAIEIDGSSLQMSDRA
ncbi:filamentous hemagglutinin N-terminal domain-containing protein, partial [Leptolyngbya cf. ectocarpi LEGE 11479]